jgi:hypothetical protein
MKHITLSLIVLFATTQVLWAAPVAKGRVLLQRDETYEQNLRWEASADKNVTPAKVMRWIMGLRGQALSAPSSTEFQPIFKTENGHIRAVAAIAFKF